METKCSFSLLLVISGMGGRSTHPPGLARLAGAQRMGGKGRQGRARSAQRTGTRLSLTCRCRRDGSIGLTGHLDGGGAGVTGERGAADWNTAAGITRAYETRLVGRPRDQQL